jgi:putative transposase
MNILRAYKTELDLNNQQRTACVRHAGVARFAFNWGLERKITAYQSGKKTPSAIDLHRELNRLKQSEFSWMYEVSKCAPQEALRDLDRAFKNFFRRVEEKKAGKCVKVGFPRFKSRKKGVGSFRLTGTIRIFNGHIQLPRLGVLKLKEKGYLPVTDVHILNATVSERAGRWFVSLQVEMEIRDPEGAERPVAGVDLGINRLAQVSDGTYFENPRALKKAQKKLKRLQRVVSRRQKGSANYQKAVHQLAKAHARVANIRKNAVHQVTTWLVRHKSAIVLEDLNVSGMMKNHHLAQSIADVGLHEFRRQLQYKGQWYPPFHRGWYGCEVFLADRFFPSSKQCSQCGVVKDNLRLGQRTYHCEHCGLVIDRDWNAALNLEQLLTVS